MAEKRDQALSIRMSKSLRDRLASAAADDQRTMAQYVVLVLERHFAEQDRKASKR